VQHLCFDTNGTYEQAASSSSSSERPTFASPSSRHASGGERKAADGEGEGKSVKDGRIELKEEGKKREGGGGEGDFGVQQPAASQRRGGAADDTGQFAL
jgi:hypothetical protein